MVVTPASVLETKTSVHLRQSGLSSGLSIFLTEEINRIKVLSNISCNRIEDRPTIGRMKSLPSGQLGPKVLHLTYQAHERSPRRAVRLEAR